MPESSNPLITISIPTYNSEAFLGLCLESVKNQTYKDFEINIVDKSSSDQTVKIAKNFGVNNIITCNDALLKAREVGVTNARGEYILLLDCDQVLEPDSLERAINLMATEKYDMLIFEEDVYRADTFLEKLFQTDRKLVHAVKDYDPYTSVMLPRFYKADLLKKAFVNIPPEALKSVGGQDHAIIYFEAWQYSQKVTLLTNAVKHIEPSSIVVMVRKFYRWGKTSVGAHNERYELLLKRKEKFRKGLFTRGYVKASLASIILLLIKGVPYKMGYIAGLIGFKHKK